MFLRLKKPENFNSLGLSLGASEMRIVGDFVYGVDYLPGVAIAEAAAQLLLFSLLRLNKSSSYYC